MMSSLALIVSVALGNSTCQAAQMKFPATETAMQQTGALPLPLLASLASFRDLAMVEG